MGRVVVDDGTLWPNPKCEKFHDIAWRLIHCPYNCSKEELMFAASVMEAYSYLTGEPTLTLEKLS